MTTAQAVAQSMKLLMSYQNKSRKELAQLIGTSANRASAILNGKAVPQIDELYQIARWLGVTTDQLCRGFEITPIAKAA